MGDPESHDGRSGLRSSELSDAVSGSIHQQRNELDNDASSSGGALHNDLVAANEPTRGDTAAGGAPVELSQSLEARSATMSGNLTNNQADQATFASSSSSQDRDAGGRILPDLLREEAPSSTVRDDLTAKLRKINTLIGNASEIQKKYHAVNDPASQKSILEMLEKLLEQREGLEEELHHLSYMEIRNESLRHQDASTSSAARQPLSEQMVSLVQSPEPPSRRPTTPSHEDLTHSVCVLRGNLKDVLERKGELEAMVEVLRCKLAQCETKEERDHLAELLERHTQRIAELNRTVREAQQTLTAMDNLNRQRNELKVAEKEREQLERPEVEDDSPADEDTMHRLRDRLKKMRAQIHTVGVENGSAANAQGTVSVEREKPVPHRETDRRKPLNPREAMLVVDQHELEQMKQRGGAEQFYAPVPPPVRGNRPETQSAFAARVFQRISDQQNWNNMEQSPQHNTWEETSRDRGIGPYQFDQTMSTFLRGASDRGAEEFAAESGSFEQVQSNQYERLDSNRSSDSEVDEFVMNPDEFLQGPRRILVDNRTNNNNSTTFGKRNDLGLPQTPKKESNSRNWKNGAESGRGRLVSAGESSFHDARIGCDQYLQADRVHEPAVCQSDVAAEAPSRDMPVADMVKSLQLIMAEQQKILNTCAQFVSKASSRESGARSCSPDQLRSDRSNRGGIPMINNTLRTDDSCSGRANVQQHQGLLNNQRNDARGFSMSPNTADGAPVDMRVRNRFADHRTESGALFTMDPSISVSDIHRDDPINFNGSRGRNPATDLSRLMDTVLVEYQDDLSTLHYMMDCISSVTSSAARARVAGQLGFIVAAEKGMEYANSQMRPQPIPIPGKPIYRASGMQHHERDTRDAYSRAPRMVSRPSAVAPDLVGNVRQERMQNYSLNTGGYVQLPTAQRSPGASVFDLPRPNDSHFGPTDGNRHQQHFSSPNCDPTGSCGLAHAAVWSQQQRNSAGITSSRHYMPLLGSVFGPGRPLSSERSNQTNQPTHRGEISRRLNPAIHVVEHRPSYAQQTAHHTTGQDSVHRRAASNIFSVPCEVATNTGRVETEPNERSSGSNGSTAEYDMANDYSRPFDHDFSGNDSHR